MEDDKQKAKTTDMKDIEKNKINAVLSYFGILIIVPLLSEDAKKSEYAKFHMNQGLVLSLAGFVGSFVFWIPLLGWAGAVALFVIWIMGLMSAVNGEMKEVPLLGGIKLIK